MRYKVISRAIKDDFEQDVNDALADGWQLHGTLIPGDGWKQVMIKREERTGFSIGEIARMTPEERQYYTKHPEEYDR